MPEPSPDTPQDRIPTETENIYAQPQHVIISPEQPETTPGAVPAPPSLVQQNILIHVPVLVRLTPLLVVIAMLILSIYRDSHAQDPWFSLNVVAFIVLLLPFFVLSIFFLVMSYTKKGLRRMIIALVAVGILSTPGGLGVVFGSITYLAKVNQISADKGRVSHLGYDIYVPPKDLVGMPWSDDLRYPSVYDNEDVGTVVTFGADEIVLASYDRTKAKFGDCPPSEMLSARSGNKTCTFFAKTPSGIAVYQGSSDNDSYFFMHKGSTQIMFSGVMFLDSHPETATERILQFADGFKKTDVKDVTFLVKSQPTKL